MLLRRQSRRPPKSQAALAGSLGERPNAPVVLVAAAVEQAGLDVRLLGPAGQDLAGALGLVERCELPELGLRPCDGDDRPGLVVVDELGEHPAVRPKD